MRVGLKRCFACAGEASAAGCVSVGLEGAGATSGGGGMSLIGSPCLLPGAAQTGTIKLQSKTKLLRPASAFRLSNKARLPSSTYVKHIYG